MPSKSAKNPARKPGKKPGARRVAPYHHGDLHRVLVDRATRLVQKHGHLAITVREVARHVGVTHTAAHYHFRTREALLAAVATRGFEAMTAALTGAMHAATGSSSPPGAPHLDPPSRALPSADESAARLAALGHTYVAHALEHGRMYQLMFSAETALRDEFPDLGAASDRMFALLVDAIRDGQATGIVRHGNPIDSALVAWSASHGLASLALERRLAMPGLVHRTTGELIGIVLRGIGAGIYVAPPVPAPPIAHG
jgi:AcrR family transcriptional regulator